MCMQQVHGSIFRDLSIKTSASGSRIDNWSGCSPSRCAGQWRSRSNRRGRRWTLTLATKPPPPPPPPWFYRGAGRTRVVPRHNRIGWEVSRERESCRKPGKNRAQLGILSFHQRVIFDSSSIWSFLNKGISSSFLVVSFCFFRIG